MFGDQAEMSILCIHRVTPGSQAKTIYVTEG